MTHVFAAAAGTSSRPTRSICADPAHSTRRAISLSIRCYGRNPGANGNFCQNLERRKSRVRHTGRDTMRIRQLAAPLLLILLSLAGCGTPIEGSSGLETTPTDDQVSPTEPPATDTTGTPTEADLEWWRIDRELPVITAEDIANSAVAEYNYVPLEVLWHAAEHVVRATIVEVEGPYWNQASGQHWEWSGGILPTPYREITVEVIESYRGEFAPGEQIIMLVQGAGPDVGGGPFWEGATLTLGAEIVTMVQQLPYAMREGFIDVLTPIRGPTGILDRHVLEDGTVVFRPQLSSGKGQPILDGQTISDLYPDGVPIDGLQSLTTDFELRAERPDYFDHVYDPYNTEGR